MVPPWKDPPALLYHAGAQKIHGGTVTIVWKKMKNIVDIFWVLYYTYVCDRGVAQFGRALRSGRRGRKFESCRLDLYKSRPVGQAVKTTPSHGVNPGSIPGQVMKLYGIPYSFFFMSIIVSLIQENPRGCHLWGFCVAWEKFTTFLSCLHHILFFLMSIWYQNHPSKELQAGTFFSYTMTLFEFFHK